MQKNLKNCMQVKHYFKLSWYFCSKNTSFLIVLQANDYYLTTTPTPFGMTTTSASLPFMSYAMLNASSKV